MFPLISHPPLPTPAAAARSAVIFPPSGTPYSGGAFTFDILLPADYPHKPPKVQFLTTGGGRVRFNPNLYADGKVCLSLLGTWAGPSWDPAKSTLLQVLVRAGGVARGAGETKLKWRAGAFHSVYLVGSRSFSFEGPGRAGAIRC